MTEKNNNQNNNALILAYNDLISSKKITDDEFQRQALQKLQNLLLQVEERFSLELKLFKRILGKKKPVPKGLYIWGGVGRGKSMLMDLFFTQLDVESKRRTHFHGFMIDVHKRIKEWHDDNLNTNNSAKKDAIQTIADEIASESKILCFDEMQVKDIADAMILGRLFEKLFEHGVVVIATSNVAPDDLYKNGLQRERFLPFIEIFKQNLETQHLQSTIDYRLQQFKSFKTTYFSPLGAEADIFLTQTLQALTKNSDAKKIFLRVKGRKIEVVKTYGDVAVFEFKELCEKPLGAEDYIEIAQRFSTIILANIPKLKPENRNEALRFINLIDALYEAKTKIICTADASVNELYKLSNNSAGDNSFEFQRTISRLIEMQSENYITAERAR
jgi:cell division protein ZapE